MSLHETHEQHQKGAELRDSVFHRDPPATSGRRGWSSRLIHPRLFDEVDELLKSLTQAGSPEFSPATSESGLAKQAFL